MRSAGGRLSVSLRNRRIWIAGHGGLVGSALMRRLRGEECALLVCDRQTLDLRDQKATAAWIGRERPDIMIMAAATVGGIEANRTRPAEFLYDNMIMAANVIHAAAECKTEKLLFLGSSCIYPCDATQPIQAGSLLTGTLEPTNEAYAIAKIAGVKLCQAYKMQQGCDFISAMPCNLYGPGDRFDPVRSHVIPAMLMKFHQARQRNDPAVTLWGTGSPLREFLHVDDLAEGLVRLLQNYSGADPVNIGSGEEISIRNLAFLIADITGYTGSVIFDSSMPDGTPRKVLESSVMRDLGWSPSISLREGLRQTYQWYSKTVADRAA